MSVAAVTDKSVWQSHSRFLADWAWERIAVKRDRHGLYSPTGGASWTFSELSKDELAAHFAGELTLGCGSTSVDDKCLWIAWDLDNHGSDEATNQNLDFAIVLLSRLAELGVHAVIEDSDGKGGIHVWAFFREPVPAAHAHRFSRWIARDFNEHGLDDCECFPKAPSVQHTEQKCGTYLRVPGKHHKRDHWSRCWGDGEWLNAEESIQLLLNAPANDAACLAHAPQPPAPEPKREYRVSETDSQALLRTALPYIECESYDTWLKVGQALHDEGDHLLDEWHRWSATSSKYDVETCEAKWKTFTRGNGVQLGTVFHLAKRNGWTQPRSTSVVGPDRAFSDPTVSGERFYNVTADSVLFEGVDVTELETYADIAPDWLVDGIFSSDQPTLFGARSKCLKTTQLVDLSVAFASGTKWLGTFAVPKPRRVLFITGESNNRAAARRIRKAIRARDELTFGKLRGMMRVEAVNFPRLPSLEDCEHIRRVVDRHQPDVIIIDPLYRGLGADIDAHRMAEVGDAIVYFAQCCQPAALIISHHVIKSSAREYGSPPELEDLAGAGIAESCGNWWLVGRNEKYAWDWQHDLCVAFGGRDEQAGGRRILFDEQRWAANVSKLSEFQASRDEERRRADEEQKRDEHYRKIESARARVSAILRQSSVPMSKNAIEQGRGGAVTQTSIREAIFDMESDGTITKHQYRDSQNRLQSGGLMLAETGRTWDESFHQKEKRVLVDVR